MTFPGTASVLISNPNSSLPLDSDIGAASSRVLAVDATISQAHQANVANRYANTYTGIYGEFKKGHRAAHLGRRIPVGGYLGMLDGHVEWRKSDKMIPRTDSVQTDSPVFWC